MTESSEIDPILREERMRQSFTQAFDRVGAGAVERERNRELPYEQFDVLKAAGFTRVTLPAEFGGEGATHEEFFELLTELARRDPNTAQALRSHFAYVDRTLHAPDSPQRTRRLQALADGAIHGNATFERSAASVGQLATTLTDDGDGLRLDGVKYYSTGTLYADQISVLADRGGEQVSVIVKTDADGLTRVDDWDGFGQRLTGSGTTTFTNVRVEPEQVLNRDEAPAHSGAFVQLVLLAVAAGIGRAVVDDAARYVRTRTRAFSHGAASTTREDPIVQEVVGELSARSFAADAAVAAAARAIGAASRAARASASDASKLGAAKLATAADIATTRAQLVVLPAVLAAATELFEVGGASALSEKLALDRHWRNARAVASHNPARYKARILGDHLINGTAVPLWWTTGQA